MGDCYADGYRNGHLDRYMGIAPLITALTCPEYNMPGYAQGYYDGYYYGRYDAYTEHE